MQRGRARGQPDRGGRADFRGGRQEEGRIGGVKVSIKKAVSDRAATQKGGMGQAAFAPGKGQSVAGEAMKDHD